MYNNIADLLKNNRYPGRGIIVGMTSDKENIVNAYFIMGRSENSRNRVFKKSDDGIMIKPYDESKVEDPSLIIYHPVRKYENKIIVTNGDQTDTILGHLQSGKTFEDALVTRTFEPDSPNFTPRISSIVFLDNPKGINYKMSILKSINPNSDACARHTYSYEFIEGVGHFIHTYKEDGNPIPSFIGEPVAIEITNSINHLSDTIWNSLDNDNKISLYVRYTNVMTGKFEEKIINKFS